MNGNGYTTDTQAQQQYCTAQAVQGTAQQCAQPMQQPYQQYGMTPPVVQAEPMEDRSSLLIALCVLEFLFLGGIFTAIPLIFVKKYRRAVRAGDWVTAQDAYKTSKIALIGVAVFALCVLMFAYVL